MGSLPACFGFSCRCTISSLEEIQGLAGIYQAVRTDRDSLWKCSEKGTPTVYFKTPNN